MNIDTGILDEFTKFINKKAAIDMGISQPAQAPASKPEETIQAPAQTTGQPTTRISDTQGMASGHTLTPPPPKASTSNQPIKITNFNTKPK